MEKLGKGSGAADWFEAELADTIDEDYELELSEPALSIEVRKIYLKARPPAIARAEYFRALFALQAELIKLQDWVSYHKEKVIVIFEGRDSAGKGSAIKRITQRLNPRTCRTVALPAPTEREKTQWYFQRYVPHLPAGGEIVLLDRSWYNRSGVERVMGFASEDQVEQFFSDVPEFERMLVRSGIRLIKYWFSITDEEQQLRFIMRIHDPLKQWKLSPMDLESACGGKPTPRRRKRRSPARISAKPPGTSSKATTRDAPGSTVLITCSPAFPTRTFRTRRSPCLIAFLIRTTSARCCRLSSTCRQNTEPRRRHSGQAALALSP